LYLKLVVIGTDGVEPASSCPRTTRQLCSLDGRTYTNDCLLCRHELEAGSLGRYRENRHTYSLSHAQIKTAYPTTTTTVTHDKEYVQCSKRTYHSHKICT